jgi:MoaA/NifB/PqqE/SkfB family radical SAM enzyme
MKSKRVITKRGMVMYDPAISMTVRLNREETKKLMYGKEIDFEKLDDHCEIVHIEITSMCDKTCAYCYNPKNENDLSTEELVKLIDNLANAEVFQITFGGGEPFTREDIGYLASHAKSVGLNVCATTNGRILNSMCVYQPNVTSDLLKSFGQINVSYHGSEFEFGNILNIAAVCKKIGVKMGINFCCQDEYMKKLDWVAGIARDIDAELLMLAYKPVRPELNIKGPSGPEIVKKAFELASKYNIDTGVDGACVRQCMASIRFCDVHPNGDVSVCSFKREPIGNALREDFKEIWARRPKEVECPHFPLRNNP